MPLQPIQLDDRNFEQLFAEARARIPVHTPEWTNFNDSDPGITIIQLFAFMTENLLYRSNRIPEANRRKFLMLLGIGLQPATPGRGLASFSNNRGPLKAFTFDCGQVLLAGKVSFLTRTPATILPVDAVAFYKKPQNDLNEAAKQQYQMLFQTFLNADTQQLQFYKATQMEQPQAGKPLPEIDLADSVNDSIDQSLWVALVAPPNVPIDQVRAAISGQVLSLGIHPALGADTSTILPPANFINQPVSDPGLVFQIAAPDPDPSNPGVGLSTSQPKYVTLTPEYAENVLEYPGIVKLKLPPQEKLLLWNFDPEEEGTGDFPPLIEDKGLAKRIVTWLRISLPRPGLDQPAQGNGSKGSSGSNGSTGGMGGQSVRNSFVGPAVKPQTHTRLTWVGANTARVIQAILVQNEPLGFGTGAPDQTYTVANTPILLQGKQPNLPGEPPQQTLVVQVQDANGNWDTEPWSYIDDLYAARPDDKVYSVDPEAGKITFGNGINGFRPAVGRNIRVTYEYGGGLDGQVEIGTINKGPKLPGGFKVGNPVQTWGAAPAETAAHGERNIPRYLKHRDRLVTATDFRDITLSTPGLDIGRVEVLPLFNPDMFDPEAPLSTWPGAVTVMVIPRTDPAQPDAPLPDRLFLDTVASWLDPRRLITTEVFVRAPSYVRIWVSVGIVTLPGQFREVVQRNVMNAIRDYLSPLTGGPPAYNQITLEAECASSDASSTMTAMHGTGWPLNMDVRRQDLEAVATRVAGVRYVDSIRLGIAPEDGGSTLVDVESVSMLGLQLPRLVGISVREGPATNVADLLGQPLTPPSTGGPGAGGPGNPSAVPVPVLPQKC
jgi:hypothetical protein